MTRTTNEIVPPKGPPSGSHNNSQKYFESERISSHIDAFEKSGGHIEKLGVTRYVNKPASTKPIMSDPARPAKVSAHGNFGGVS
jgi:hypothetical protein